MSCMLVVMQPGSEPESVVPEPEKVDAVADGARDQAKVVPSQKRVAETIGVLTLGVVVGITGTLGVLRHQLSQARHWKKEAAVANELLRERFIADNALHELSVSQLLELSDEDLARTAHAQILEAYSSAVEGMRTSPIENREINDKLDYLEKAIQTLEEAIAGLGKEGAPADADKQRELVHSLGMVRHASLQTVYTMYRMGDDRPESATDKASQQHLSRFEILHKKVISLFESAFAKSDVYTEQFEEHNMSMLRGRLARGVAFVNKDAEAFDQQLSFAVLGGDFQDLTKKRLEK